jgi:hypothetical protein
MESRCFLWCKNRSFKHHVRAFQITTILLVIQYMGVSQRCLWIYGIISLFINVSLFLNKTLRNWHYLSKRREPLTHHSGDRCPQLMVLDNGFHLSIMLEILYFENCLLDQSSSTLTFNSMEQPHSWAANSFSASKEISIISWNPEVQYLNTVFRNCMYVELLSSTVFFFRQLIWIAFIYGDPQYRSL